MRYNIHGFSQHRAVELGLTNDDLLVLRWFVDFCSSGKMQKIEESGKTYYWVRYQAVLDDLPILSIGKDRLFRKHFRTLCEARILVHKHINVGGRFSYYCLGENYETLVYGQDSTHTVNLPHDMAYMTDDAVKLSDDTVKLPEPYGETAATHTIKLPQPCGENDASKIILLISSTNNSSIKDFNTHSPSEGDRQQPIPFEKIRELFNVTCPSLSKVMGINGKRKIAVAARWKEHPDIDFFETYFKRVEDSEFLKGKNDRNWKATFDWLMNAANMDKVREGKYDTGGKSNGTGATKEHPGQSNSSFKLSGFKTEK